MTQSDFQGNLKKENTVKVNLKNFSFQHFPYPNFMPIFSLRFSTRNVSLHSMVKSSKIW